MTTLIHTRAQPHDRSVTRGQQVMQLAALLLMGVEVGVSYSHFMQWQGKLALDQATYLVVQSDLIQYFIGMSFIEIPLVLILISIVWLARRQRAVLILTLAALGCCLLAFGIWGTLIEPINQQIDDQALADLPADWSRLRNQWHIYHLARLIAFVLGMIMLSISVIVQGASTDNNLSMRSS